MESRMSDLSNYFRQNCTPEQSALLDYCIDSLRNIGLTEIDYGIAEVLSQLDQLDSSEVIQRVYEIIRTGQNMAMGELEISLDNTEDIRPTMDILNAIYYLEDSEESRRIIELIETGESPEDVLVDILTDITYLDESAVLSTVLDVKPAFIYRLEYLHESESVSVRFDPNRIPPPLDEKCKNIIKGMWQLKTFMPVRNYVMENKLNLPVKLESIQKIIWEQVKPAKNVESEEWVARRLLEAAIVIGTPYINLKIVMKKLANDIFEDLFYTTKLSYEIDNLIMGVESNDWT